MRILTGILAAGLVVSGAAMAQAQSSGWYIGAEGGINFHPDADISGPGVNRSVEFDDIGYGILGQGGYSFGQIRAEAELGWRTVGVENVTGVTASDGDIDAYSLMANLYYDIPTGTAFTPYIGAGVGGAYVSAEDLRLNNAGLVADGGDWAFAYQGIAGVAYAINNNLSLKADYRYFATTDVGIEASNGADYDMEYAAHSVMVGFTYKFGQPAPAPTPVAAPAPAPAPVPAPAPKAAPVAPMPKSFIVFFDFDKANVTSEATSIVQKAAASAKQGNVARVELVGHADRVGSDKYNLALSEKRAQAVKDELVRQGVPANAIVTVARGESAPLISTPDGIREPQNRRVEIVLP